MVVAKHVLYGGRVQGVGFRYTAHRLAQGLHVAGTVRNLPSGEVELIAEGPSDQVDQLLRLIAVEMAGNVQDAQVTETVPVGLQGFQILH